MLKDTNTQKNTSEENEGGAFSQMPMARSSETGKTVAHVKALRYPVSFPFVPFIYFLLISQPSHLTQGLAQTFR